MWKVERFKSFGTIIFLATLMWSVFLFQNVIPGIMDYGLEPRTISGLRGIIFAPFIHKDFSHIFSNTISLFIFGIMYTLFEGKQPTRLIGAAIIYSGIFHWLVGTSGMHIGMSGVIYALYAFLLSVGFFHHKVKYIIVSLVVISGYSYLLWDMLPLNVETSWTGHLTGFLTGLMISKYKEN